MSKDRLVVNDKLHFNDNIDVPFESTQGPTMWRKTEIIGGYGDIINNPNGKSTVGEEIFRTHNIVPVGGVSYAMEKIFGIKDKQITVPTLHTLSGIGVANSVAPIEQFDTPEGKKTANYRHGNYVQLYGVGITGSAENDVSIYEPDYRENSININRANSDGLTINGTMLPFRYTHTTLSISDKLIYFGKKEHDAGISGYYLKRFIDEPVIKHIYKTGEDVENEELISNSEMWENTSGRNTVESFTEFFIKISKADIKEWFASIEQEKRARINTIALFSGEYVPSESGGGDFRDVRLYSKLCINPEYLDLAKDLNIIYRVYGA